MIDEKGVVLYASRWIKGGPPDRTVVRQLNYWRQRLRDRGLVGVTPSGIGYGNMSVRGLSPDTFVITGTQTGHIESTSAHDYTRVLDFCLTRNRLTSVGPIEASSEAMTHGIVYRTRGTIRAVVHVHSSRLWSELRGRAPTTAASVEAGTPGMALEVERLLREPSSAAQRLIVMGGHTDGLLSFGASLADAAEAVLCALDDPRALDAAAVCPPRYGA